MIRSMLAFRATAVLLFTAPVPVQILGMETQPPPAPRTARKVALPNPELPHEPGTPPLPQEPIGAAAGSATSAPPQKAQRKPLLVEVSRPIGTDWVVRVDNPGDEWWRSPAWWSPIIGLLIAAVGWFLSNRQVTRQLTEQRDQQKNQFTIENAQKRGELVRNKLNSFYRPYKQLSDTNKLLHEVLKRSQPDPDFRTLISLLEHHAFSSNDKALVDEIVKIGSQLEGLLAKESGWVDDPKLRRSFAQVSEHFRVLRLASEGKLSGDPNRFRDKVYPRDLDCLLDEQIATLECELQGVEEFLKKLTASAGADGGKPRPAG